MCVLSQEAAEADEWEIYGTDNKLLPCPNFQVCLFFIGKQLQKKKIIVSVGHRGLQQLFWFYMFL